MFLRDTDFPTLGDVAAEMTDRRRTWSGSSTAVKVHIASGEGDEGQATGIIDLGKHEVPVSAQGIQALAQFYDIPYKFLARITPDEQQFILDNRIQRAEDLPLVLKYDDNGISEAYKATIMRIDPAQMVERLLEQVFPEESPVVDHWNTPDEFRLDVIVPTDYSRGIGGDKKVGDLTHGGLRIGQNRKQNLAPWTQPIMFRLACTNGMEVPDFGMRIEARGVVEPEDIITQVVGNAKDALKRVEKDIEHFYDLRSQPVEGDYTGLFRRMTRDMGLPDRTIGNMENTLADALMAEDEVTMFHLVNHITNEANNPTLAGHSNARRALQQAGGQAISDHAARCERCHSRLN